MAYSGCKPNTLVFSENGFTFVHAGGERIFPPHLKNSAGEIELFAIDGCLSIPERPHHDRSLSDLIATFFSIIGQSVRQDWDSTQPLRVLRPFQFHPDPAHEGLAVVRLKQSLFRAFPECKLVFLTPEETGPGLSTHYSFESHGQTERTVRGGEARRLFEQELAPVLKTAVEQIRQTSDFSKAAPTIQERYASLEYWNFLEADPLISALRGRHPAIIAPMFAAREQLLRSLS